jgi:hypothetical protein
LTRNYYGCGTYTPYASTVPDGDYFVQSASCYRDYEKTYTHKLGTTIVHTRVQSTTSTETRNKGAYGTKDMSISATYGCPSGWIESGNSNRCYTDVFPLPASGVCPSGYTITNAGNKCADYINMSYSCPSGYSLSGSRCYP